MKKYDSRDWMKRNMEAAKEIEELRQAEAASDWMEINMTAAEGIVRKDNNGKEWGWRREDY